MISITCSSKNLSMIMILWIELNRRSSEYPIRIKTNQTRKGIGKLGRDSEREKKIEPFLAASVILLRAIGVTVGIGGWSVQIGERADSASSTVTVRWLLVISWRHWFHYSQQTKRITERERESNILWFMLKNE